MISILVTILAAIASFGSLLTGLDHQPEAMQLGAFGDTFLSIQLATSPTSGEFLTTDGTDNSWSAAGAVGAPGAWEQTFANTLSPTNTSAGIFVRGSSTIEADFRISGHVTTTGSIDSAAYCFVGDKCFAGRPSPNIYDAVVDAGGNGDYTDIQSAIAAGKIGIFL